MSVDPMEPDVAGEGTTQLAEDGKQSSWAQRVDDQELLRMLQVEAMELPDMGIAISGISGRYPKADSVNEFEENLANKVDMITDQDDSRFPCGLWGLPARAGRLKNISRFDAHFFGYTNEDANCVDFQLRLLYEVVYESIIDAGLNPAQLRGTNTGVFFGLHCEEFEPEMNRNMAFRPTGYSAQFAIKIAQYFDLRGMTATLDTACSSGLVGLHNATQALKDGLVERAIVCSCNIPVNPRLNYGFLLMGTLSPGGRVRFLDSRADGYVKSEACVSVLLEAKQVARRNYALLMATMDSADGYKTEGFTFPSDRSQQRLIEATRELAGISTNHVEYVEAHGTGTPAGDPQESNGIARAYFPKEEERQTDELAGKTTDERLIGPLLLGSVKTNMGHSEAVSGLCGLSKVVLMFEHELIYPSLHYEQPNPKIAALIDGRLKPVAELRQLRSKIIPISSYGFGGANAHAIVRANHRPTIGDLQTELESLQGQHHLYEPRLVLMFGRSQEAVESFFDRIQDVGSRSTRNCLSDDFLALVDSLSAGKIDRLMEFRGYLLVDRLLAIKGQASGELVRCVRSCVLERPQGLSEDVGRPTHLQECRRPKLSIILPGLGCQRARAAANLRLFAPFWSTIERLAGKIALVDANLDLMQLLSEDEDADKEMNERRQSMCEIFVSIVAYQLALINLVRDRLGLDSELEFVCGHSLGEISCAYSSGLLDERQTILLAYHLGAELEANKQYCAGKMVAVEMSASETLQLIYSPQFAHLESVRIACINGRKSVSLSGRTDEVVELTSWLRKQPAVRVHEIYSNSIGLHNETIMDDTIRQKLRLAAEKVLFEGSDFDRSQTVWMSSGISGLEAAGTASSWQVSADYFAANLCKQVDFLSCLERIPPESIVLELAPVGLFGGQLRDLRPHQTYVSQSRRTPLERQTVELLSMLGELYLAGLSLDLSKLYADGRPVELPVRRQTPSLSSLVVWNHERELFVPRYPAQFNDVSADSEVHLDIADKRFKYLNDHSVDGRVLYPATGCLFLVWRAFSAQKRRSSDVFLNDLEKELVPIEFRDVRLMRAIILTEEQTHLCIHLDPGTGKFTIREGDSVAAEGYVRSPDEQPDGLLFGHVGEQIRAEHLKMALNTEDVYKQFRVCGYDYGESFQNVRAASADGRHCLVKHSGRFIAFTDSIFQCILLSANHQLISSGGLFLPTKFDYVRFQPKQILAKIRAAGMVFDLAEESLNNIGNPEVSTRNRPKKSASVSANRQTANSHRTTQEEEGGTMADTNEQQRPECLFDVFCEPVTGVIVSDGIEIRGIRTALAPPRANANKSVSLESYQFVADIERPIEDERLTQYERHLRPYVLRCDLMAQELLSRLSGNRELKSHANFETDRKDHLSSLVDDLPSIASYDIQHNGQRSLMSMLDLLLGQQLEATNRGSAQMVIKKLVLDNRAHLERDFVLRSFVSERFLRPLVETITENCLARNKHKFMRILEVNSNDVLVYPAVQCVASNCEPLLQLDYSLAHPDINRLTTAQTLPPDGRVNTLAMHSADLDALVSEHNLRDFDAVIYKDVSCYALTECRMKTNRLSPRICALNSALKPGGFALVLMRHKLTLAEGVLLSLSESDFLGLKNGIPARRPRRVGLDHWVAGEIERMNSLLAERLELLLAEAQTSKMILLAHKSDPSGCTALLFRTTQRVEDDKMNVLSVHTEPFMVRVSHGHIDEWLPRLREFLCFSERFDTTVEEDVKKGATVKPTELPPVWLCAVATRRQPVSGVLGMVQALRKEFGSSRLRCFYDVRTFSEREEQPELDEIAQSSTFKLALERDLLWCYVDELGRLGSYRHLQINEYFNHADCLCDKQKDSDGGQTYEGDQPVAAYAMNSTRGDLTSFAWFEAPLKYLDDVERARVIRVAYSALNFRDIMLSTGRLSLDAIPIKLALTDCLLGVEFSGVDVNGKRVMGMISGRGIATQIVYPPTKSIKLDVPDWMSLREAATITVVYATSVLAIMCRGRAQRGESILIHAGSGGVGQAAIRLSAHLGLKIFTTVGSREKREFILEEFAEHLSDDRIFSSRDCNFEAKIMEATQGRGVDLVLNSLADDKLQASVRCLADGGRFLEIGKYDMSMDTKLELLRLDTNKSFHGIFLDELFFSDNSFNEFSRQKDDLLAKLTACMREGCIKPIKHTCFKRHQMEEALRYMGNGQHIGKVLVEIDDRLEKLRDERSLATLPLPRLRCLPRVQLSPLKSYLITGGLGGMGLEISKWLVSRGARHLVLTTRSGVRTGYQTSVLTRLASISGTKILLVRADQADPGASLEGARNLCSLAQQLAPSRQLGGLFHLAMVLKDSLLENMSSELFELVCRPKLDACAHLDEATRELAEPLDHFVAFSSVSSGKGTGGQANYAYANSFLERICERRRRDNLHGLAIQWGMIGDVGAFYGSMGDNETVNDGAIPQRMPSCLATLERLLTCPFSTCMSLVPIDQQSTTAVGKVDLVDAVMNVLCVKDVSKVSEQATLSELGLDSLMAVEIRQSIERELDLTLSVQEIRSLTIAKIKEMGAAGQRAAAGVISSQPTRLSRA